jgi:anti-sigma regulatory factor (Ser/Thr protein kinase)
MNVGAIDRDQRTFDAVPTSARSARQFVTATLGENGATATAMGDFALVVSELATNIIEHGNGPQLTVWVDVSDPGWWGVEVVGSASSTRTKLSSPDTWTVAGAEEISGRGLGIVHHLMDDIATDTTDGQVSVRCRQRRAEAT